MDNKIKVGKVKYKNSSYINTLYVVFDIKGKFLYFQYGDFISCYIDDILINASIFNADIEHLRKFENLG